MNDPPSLIANIIQILGGIIATIVFIRKTLRNTKRNPILPQSKSIFSLTKDKANSVVSRILPGKNEPVLLHLNYKKIDQSNQSGILRTFAGSYSKSTLVHPINDVDIISSRLKNAISSGLVVYVHKSTKTTIYCR
jgi:hypothetical protein